MSDVNYQMFVFFRFLFPLRCTTNDGVVCRKFLPTVGMANCETDDVHTEGVLKVRKCASSLRA